MSTINFACSVFLSLVLSQILSLAACGTLNTSPNFNLPDTQPATLHSHQINSGLLNLIVKSYIEDFLSDFKLEDEVVKQKLINLGNHISTHPALKQKNLYVGDKPPNYDPDYMRTGSVRSLASINKRQNNLPPQATTTSPLFSLSPNEVAPEKSSMPSQFPSEEICITDRQWEQINETNDFYDNKVQVIQREGLQQFVFTYRCANVKGPCTGIQPFYQSECTERFGWVYLYHRKGNDPPQWGYVAAPHHCACKIQPNATPSSRKRR